jgi:hypothetical protein
MVIGWCGIGNAESSGSATAGNEQERYWLKDCQYETTQASLQILFSMVIKIHHYPL